MASGREGIAWRLNFLAFSCHHTCGTVNPDSTTPHIVQGIRGRFFRSNEPSLSPNRGAAKTTSDTNLHANGPPFPCLGSTHSRRAP